MIDNCRKMKRCVYCGSLHQKNANSKGGVEVKSNATKNAEAVVLKYRNPSCIALIFIAF